MEAVRKSMTEVAVGDFVSYTMVTDTRVYEVVGKTAKTLKLRGTRDSDFVRSKSIGGNPYPVVWTGVEADPTGVEMVVRLRKDGTYRTHRSGNPLRIAYTIEGVPVRYTDYRF